MTIKNGVKKRITPVRRRDTPATYCGECTGVSGLKERAVPTITKMANVRNRRDATIRWTEGLAIRDEMASLGFEFLIGSLL